MYATFWTFLKMYRLKWTSWAWPHDRRQWSTPVVASCLGYLKSRLAALKLLTATVLCLIHRRMSSVNFRGRTFLPEKYAWKINKMPEFFMFLARKIIKIPEFYVIFAGKMPEFFPKNAWIFHNNCQIKIFFPNFRDVPPPPMLPRLLRLWPNTISK